MASSTNEDVRPAFSGLRVAFSAVDHLNLGAELISDTGERRDLARLNLEAGRRAVDSAAFVPALAYLEAGLRLLPVGSWQHDYNLTLMIYTQAAEAAALSADYARMERLIEIVHSNAHGILDTMPSYEIRIQSYIARGAPGRAVDEMRAVVGRLGIHLPKRPTQLDALSAVLRCVALDLRLRRFGLRPVRAYTQLKPLCDPTITAAMRLISITSSAAYFAEPNLIPSIVHVQLRNALRHGYTETTPYVLAGFSFMLAAALDNIDGAYKLATLALELAMRPEARLVRAKTYTVVYILIAHRKQHFRETIAPLQEGYRHGLDAGDFEYASMCAYIASYCYLLMGADLATVEAEAARAAEVGRSLKQELNQMASEALRQLARCLMGQNADPRVLHDEHFDEEEFLQRFIAGRELTTQAVFHIYKTMLYYMAYEPDRAAEWAERGRSLVPAVVGTPYVAIYAFWAGMALLGRVEQDGRGRERALRTAATHLKLLRQWARHAPMNYGPYAALLAAESARAAREHSAASLGYDTAIAAAREHGNLLIEALASELAARLALEEGKHTIASGYLREAFYAYERWGGAQRLRTLAERYRDLLPDPALPAAASPTTRAAARTPSLSTTTGVGALDIATVVKATHAISSEMDLRRLLAKLLEILIENAGAQKGMLLLGDETGLRLEAAGSVDSEQVALLQSLPVEECTDLAIAAADYVVRTREPLVVADATQAPLLAQDSYVAARQPRSLLCMPLLNQGQLCGVLYLENNLSEGAFTPDRLEILHLLAAQAAISIQNARLYSELRAYRDHLEDMVTRRTHELAESNTQLAQARDAAEAASRTKSMFLSNMSHELRTPLNAIIGYSEMLQEELEANDQVELIPDLQKIRNAGRHLLTLINDILDLSKIEAGKMDLYLETFDLAQLVTEVIDTARPLTEQRGNRLQLDLGPALSFVVADATKVRQILLNLLSNAAKFTQAGTIVLRVRRDDAASTICFEVSDTGIGMSAEQMTRLFQPFTQADAATTRKYGGTGLGLAISHYFCQMMGGTISVESNPGQGSTFRVALPAVVVEGKANTIGGLS